MFGRLFAADLKMIFRNRQALFWAIAFPIMFATIFGLFNLDELPDADVAVFAEDRARSAPVLAGLEQVGAIQVRDDVASEAEARDLLDEGDLDFILLVPERGPLTLVLNGRAADTNRILAPVVERVLDELNLRLSGVERAYELDREVISGRADEYYDFLLPGLVGMAVMSYGIIGLASTIAQWRGQKILRRIRATPLRPSTFLSAVVLSHLVLAVVQSAIVLVFGIAAFGGTVRGNVLWIAILVVLGNLTFLNIGFMVATRVESAEAASGIGNAVTIPMMFFSGVFFPTSTLPWILPALTRILPLRPLVDAIRKVALDAASVADLGSELAQLGAWALVTFVLASRVFRFERA